ncbi:hypothetical protein LAWI1_G000868 [Lachnellula willkommii]|uniref:Uncharacterized protein n=1 Tax=Lachnellula willkommii TaxID=215461 RepID=A0A559MJN8_9HELO|nr:hypothetical protein LAWI1_G000868 [Lachnellula willkommii]
MDEGRKMILLFPSLIKFKGHEEKEKFDATCHMFYGSRLVDVKDGLPKWTGLDGKSELIEDSPVEMVRKRKREIEEEEDGKGEEREGEKEKEREKT